MGHEAVVLFDAAGTKWVPSWSPGTIATTASTPNHATTSRAPARIAPNRVKEQIESSPLPGEPASPEAQSGLCATQSRA